MSFQPLLLQYHQNDVLYFVLPFHFFTVGIVRYVNQCTAYGLIAYPCFFASHVLKKDVLQILQQAGNMTESRVSAADCQSCGQGFVTRSKTSEAL